MTTDAADEDLALGGLLQPGDRAEQGGLAAPGRAEQDEVLALLGRQVDAVDGVTMPAVVPLPQVPELDDATTVHRPGQPPPMRPR